MASDPRINKIHLPLSLSIDARVRLLSILELASTTEIIPASLNLYVRAVVGTRFLRWRRTRLGSSNLKAYGLTLRLGLGPWALGSSGLAAAEV